MNAETALVATVALALLILAISAAYHLGRCKGADQAKI